MSFELAYRSNSNVLITGPSGCGKSLMARQIHDASNRGGRPFVAVNLATMHEGTLESELFGHERGAFTGADRKHIGRLEAAQGGTVFLDEISELPPRLQARLLQFFQDKTIFPLGGERAVQLDVRLIAASNRNLREMVRAKTFREDLFYRLRVILIELKPLAERIDELDGLIHAVLDEICLATHREILSLSPEVASAFERYSWPGNIRELKNVLEAAVCASDRNRLEYSDLPSWFINGLQTPEGSVALADLIGVAEVPLTLDFYETLSRFEKEYLTKAFSRYGQRVNKTARKIGMDKTTLIRRLNTYGIARNTE